MKIFRFAEDSRPICDACRDDYTINHVDREAVLRVMAYHEALDLCAEHAEEVRIALTYRDRLEIR